MFDVLLISQFITHYGAGFLTVAFAWSLILCFYFTKNWRTKVGHLKKTLTLAFTSTFVGVVMYCPFIFLLLASKYELI